MRRAMMWAVLLVFAAVSACSSDNQCLPDLGSEGPSAPCLNAVSAADAGAVANTQCYVQAQVCPGKGGFPFCERVVGSSNRDSVELQNAGQSTLTIHSVRVRGDDQCAFIDPQLRDPDGGVPMEIEPQQTVLFSFRFVPPSTGQHNALLEIESDAENYPVLRIPVCGIGVPPDAGVNPVDDAGVQVCGLPMCDDRSGADFTSCWGGWGEEQ